MRSSVISNLIDNLNDCAKAAGEDYRYIFIKCKQSGYCYTKINYCDTSSVITKTKTIQESYNLFCDYIKTIGVHNKLVIDYDKEIKELESLKRNAAKGYKFAIEKLKQRGKNASKT